MPILPGSPEIARLFAEIKRNQARDWSEPPIPQQPDGRPDFSLHWGAVPQERTGDPIPLDAVRAALPSRIEAHLSGSGREVRVFALPPGTGKTYAAIRSVESLVSRGKRVLWASARHELFIDALARGANPGAWFHWRGMQSEDPDNPDQTMCRHWEAGMQEWLKKGYPSYAFCKSVCPAGGCPYRMQAANRLPVVFGMHNHLITGLDQPMFHAAVIDEVPVQSFIKRRIIPGDDLDVGGTGPVGMLTKVLRALAVSTKTDDVVMGRELFDKIGDDLSDVYAQIEVNVDARPEIPIILRPGDAYAAPYFYLMEFLEAANAEWEAWRAGWERWESRVRINSKGLLIIGRNHAWDELPDRVAVLDATASKPVYDQLFPDYEISIERPDIARRGKLYQITNRTNGKGAMQEAEEKSGDGLRQDVRIVQAIIKKGGYKNPAVITHQIAEDAYRKVGIKCEHFYNLRGSNAFEGCDAIFVVGAPQPPENAMIDMHVALSGSIDPVRDESGEVVHYIAPQYYRVTRECEARHGGLRPRRNIGGYWREPLAALMRLFRESELLQSITRGRPLTEPVDMWPITSIPIEMDADEIYADPGEAIGCPPGIYWQNWLDISERLDELEDGNIVTKENLADWTHLTVAYVKDQKWIEKIAGARDDYHEEKILIKGKRGRPPTALRKGF